MTRWRLTVLLVANALAIGTFVGAGGIPVVQLYTGIGLPERTGPPMEIVAHRGDLEQYPEDTLEAIVAAAELGVHGIEFDVHRSADGTWWVFHDASLEEATDGEGMIHLATDEELAAVAIDGGFGFVADRHDGLRIPRLDDVLAALDGFSGTIYIDVQHAVTGNVEEVARAIEGRPAAILCRTLADTRAVKEVSGDITTLLRLADGPSDGTVDAWLMEAYFEATPDALAHSALPVVTFVDEWRYGQDEAPAIRRAWSYGVEAYLSKHPARALDVVAELAGSGP